MPKYANDMNEIGFTLQGRNKRGGGCSPPDLKVWGGGGAEPSRCEILVINFLSKDSMPNFGDAFALLIFRYFVYWNMYVS